jgi:hypothetical protein
LVSVIGYRSIYFNGSAAVWACDHLFTVIIVSVLGAVFGLIGALVRKIIGRVAHFADA